jgi:hypothetical protein
MIGLGVGLGLAASRFLKASSSRRYEDPFTPVAPVAPPTRTI